MAGTSTTTVTHPERDDGVAVVRSRRRLYVVTTTVLCLLGVAVGLLDQHVRHCVSNADPEASDEMVTEATRAIERLLKA